MGCSASKLEDEEAVRLCKDRRKFIKQAVEYRTSFAIGHIAYLQSLRRISHALHNFVDGEEQSDFILDSYPIPSLAHEKKVGPELIGIPLKSLTQTPNQSEKTTIHVMKYLRSTANPSVSVEEWPQAPETGRIDSYYPSENYSTGGFFAMEPPPMNPSFFPPPPYYRSNYPPPSPQNSQYDFFWNPFSSLDTYGYPTRITSDDEMARLRQVREEEGIPELEEVEEEENREEEDDCIDCDDDDNDNDDDEYDDIIEAEVKDERSKIGLNPTKANVSNVELPETGIKTNAVHELKGLQSHGMGSIEKTKEYKAVEDDVNKKQEVVGSREAAEETPGYTVYMNRRFTSMGEVVKEIEDQFLRICDCADEVSTILEASRARYSSSSRELTAVRALNPVSLFHSTSLRSLSSRSLSSSFRACSESRSDVFASSSNRFEDSCMISESHQSTLDRLYAWEKKLYEEVKSGERIRASYEKKCTQLRSLDVMGDEPSAVFKIRAAVRDLHTRLKVSIHSVESISKRIETLRDEELHPQLWELIQGLARMWKMMGECHMIQKRAIDEAKRLLLVGPTAIIPKHPESTSPTKPPRSAANLESELRGWRSALAAWISSQRSYAQALSDWAHRCTASSTDAAIISIVDLCSRWSNLVDSVSEAQVVDGLDFFAAGISSVYRVGMERGEDDQLRMSAEKTAELAGRVLCAGMSVAVGNLTDFAVKSAVGYDGLITNTKSGEGGKEASVQI